MKKKSFLFLILIIIGIISALIFWRIMVSPQYSLRQIKLTVREHDITAFVKYVDLDEVAEHMIDQTWEYYMAQRDTGSRWSEIRRELSSSLLSVIRPNLKEIIKEKVSEYVLTGRWHEPEEDNDNVISSFIIYLVKERVNPEQWEHQSVNYAEIEGETAHVGLTYYDPEKETNFVVEVRMRDMQGYWQVVEISNLAQLVNIFHHIDEL